MPIVCFATTAHLLSVSNLLLDTHINILPASPQIFRVDCSPTRSAQWRVSVGPIIPTAADDSVSETTSTDFLDTNQFTDYENTEVLLVKNATPAVIAKSSLFIILHTNTENQRDVGESDLNTHRVEDAAAGHVIDVDDCTVLQVQDRIRAAIRTSAHLPRRLCGLSGDMMFKPFIDRQKLTVVVAFGGMSECGKSTFGGVVGQQFGDKGCREKFAYLLNLATQRISCDVYTLPETVQAHLLIQEIESFSKAHFWLSTISLESLHRLGSIVEVKRILGPLLQIVYVDVTEEERIRRQVFRVGDAKVAEKVQELKEKDAVKRSRGADKVKDFADLIINNNGPLAVSIDIFKKHLAV